LNNTAARYKAADDYAIGIPADDIEVIVQIIEAVWGTVEGFAELTTFANSPAELAALARVMRGAATPRMAASQFRHIYGELDARGALPLISAPTLVLVNRHGLNLDRATGLPERARYIAEHIPHAQLMELPGTTGLAFADDYEPLIDAVAKFLTGAPPTRPADRILTTILFTDIVASTERAASMGDHEWRRLLDAHDREIRTVIRHHRGKEIKTTGDGFLVSFDGPARAVDCAIAITQAARGLDLEITAGLHTGECERRGDDIAGLAVHVAARIAALAAPNEVLVSRTVTDLVIGSGIPFEHRGQQPLKGVPGTWDIYRAGRRN
jgi:class 3 adenylate cyclase